MTFRAMQTSAMTGRPQQQESVSNKTNFSKYLAVFRFFEQPVVSVERFQYAERALFVFPVRDCQDKDELKTVLEMVLAGSYSYINTHFKELRINYQENFDGLQLSISKKLGDFINLHKEELMENQSELLVAYTFNYGAMSVVLAVRHGETLVTSSDFELKRA